MAELLKAGGGWLHAATDNLRLGTDNCATMASYQFCNLNLG